MRSPNVNWYELAYKSLDLYPQSRWEFHACLNAFSGGDQVFEFGCGSGVFLELCGAQNIEASGCDFSPSAVQECIQKGLNAFAFEVTAPLPESIGRSASQIVAFHVLEHLERPSLLFEQAAKVAKPDAQLWIAVPSYLRPTRQRGIVDFLDQPPHHMSRWNRSALEQIGLKTGWRMNRFQTEPMPRGTVLWWIATSRPWFRRLREAGWLSHPGIERCVRFASYPSAMIRRMSVDRKLSGFAMLACYVRS